MAQIALRVLRVDGCRSIPGRLRLDLPARAEAPRVDEAGGIREERVRCALVTDSDRGQDVRIGAVTGIDRGRRTKRGDLNLVVAIECIDRKGTA